MSSYTSVRWDLFFVKYCRIFIRNHTNYCKKQGDRLKKAKGFAVIGIKAYICRKKTGIRRIQLI